LRVGIFGVDCLKGEDSGLELQFVDGTFNRFLFQRDDRSQTISVLRKSLAGEKSFVQLFTCFILDYFYADLLIEEAPYADLVAANDKTSIPPTGKTAVLLRASADKSSKRTDKVCNPFQTVNNAPKFNKRIIRLTATHILLESATGTVTSVVSHFIIMKMSTERISLIGAVQWNRLHL
jgi:hypothetical protein